MFNQVITISILATLALASQGLSAAYKFHGMLPRDHLTKRQVYYPEYNYCGAGDTCAESCGEDYVECPSNSELYCFNPTVGDKCCNDGTGAACSEGYYCASDGDSSTYCCPDSMGLEDCASEFSLTVSLVTETGAPLTISATTETDALSTINSTASITTTPIHVSSSSSNISATSSSATSTMHTLSATDTRASQSRSSGAAATAEAGIAAVLAGAAGLAGIL